MITTEIHRQERRIDVLARINHKHVLLIEDKTDMKDHSKQLSRSYDDVVEGRTKFDEVLEGDIYPIYLKTGNQSLEDDRRIQKKTNFKVFNRKHFLDALNGYEGLNPILLDFRRHLQELEKQTNSYAEWAREETRESRWAWQGFYRHLERELDNGARKIGWGHVPNPSGGFLGFWWWLSDNDELYLQIEAHPGDEAKLCFKVDSAGKSKDQQQDLKWNWHDQVLKAGRGRAIKPRVMRIGNTLTVAWWRDDWMVFGKDDKLDMSGTVENLKQAEAVSKAAMLANASGQPSV